MTAEEAKNQLIKFVHWKTTLEPVFLNVCLDALEKQVPKKVVRMHSKYQRGYNDKFLCPCCGESAETDCGDPFVNYGLEWCNNCGQHIDWREEE